MRIYLACPYTHDKAVIRKLRFVTVTRIAASLVAQGHQVFSPITHSHPMVEHGKEDLSHDFGYWVPMNHGMIDWSNAVYVLMMPGWDCSAGVKDEIEYARRTGKKVRGIPTTGKAVEM